MGGGGMKKWGGGGDLGEETKLEEGLRVKWGEGKGGRGLFSNTSVAGYENRHNWCF